MAAGEDEFDCLNWKAVAALTTRIVTFVVARLSDRFGRKRTLISAQAIAAVLALPVVLPIVNGEINHYALVILLGNGIVQAMCFGPIAAYAFRTLFAGSALHRRLHRLSVRGRPRCRTYADDRLGAHHDPRHRQGVTLRHGGHPCHCLVPPSESTAEQAGPCP